MILHAGYQTFEFLRARELPKPLLFPTRQDAIKLLNDLSEQRADMASRFREYLTTASADPETCRLTDHEVIERLATLLQSGRLLVTVRDYRPSGGKPASTPETPQPAFPLSERSQRAANTSTKKSETEPATFDPNVDAMAQSRALVAAAADGKPFCPE